MPPLRSVVRCFAATALLGAIGALAVTWSGLYSVAASRGHWAITEAFLEFALGNSVDTHSLGIVPPNLDDRDLILLGAGHFDQGCAPCHGVPGMPTNPIVQRMLPARPDLTDAARQWKPRELFWIVQNGLKFTGMPGWTSTAREDEIWAVVAFLVQLPGMAPQDYAAMSGRDGETSTLSRLKKPPEDLVACSPCHGDENAAPASRLVPDLAGLPLRYLENALRHYVEGSRQSGIMQPAAAALTLEQRRALSIYYAALPRESPAATVTPDQITRGREIAQDGVARAGIPPCLACHGPRALDAFPRLAGQSARYMTGQFDLWKKGLRAQSVTGAIMASIAQRLTAEQIDDTTAYFASLPPGTHAPEMAGAAP